MANSVRAEAFRSVLSQPISWFERPEHNVEMMAPRIGRDGAFAVRLWTDGPTVAVKILSTVLFSGGLSAYYSWSVTLIGLLGSLVGGAIVAYDTVKTRDAFQTSKQKQRLSSKLVAEGVNEVFTVAAMGCQRQVARTPCYHPLLHALGRFLAAPAALTSPCLRAADRGRVR